MPTPFYHLSVAEDLLNHIALQDNIHALLELHRGAFLFGNTAPDVQVISGQPREATHFFEFPVRLGIPAPWEQLLARYPSLAHPVQLPPDQAAFLAGYLCHLQADWLWIVEIFVPVFGLRSRWGNFPQRLYLHNVLRAYLDRGILPELTNGTAASLRQAKPARWLPFVEDIHLCSWRDELAGQLQPGAATHTVEVFAARQGISPQEYYRLLESEALMEEKIFSHLSRQALHSYRHRLVEENLHLLAAYLGSFD